VTEEGIQNSGDVGIEQLKLVSSTNIVHDLTEFLVELNIFEDIFTNFIRGNMIITDTRNLIEKLPIIGEEYLILKIKTPSFEKSIQKTFRIYKVSDRVIVRDHNTQNYILHFASIELFHDMLLPLFVPFKGYIHDVIGNIFENYIATSREYEVSQSDEKIRDDETVTPLIILNEIENQVKFVSPGWTPFKCINWLVSKSIAKNEKSNCFLFFESNKAFYVGTPEYIFQDCHENNNFIGTFTPSVSNIRTDNGKYDANREFYIASDIMMIDTTDHIKNYTSGYLTNRLLEVDVYNKRFNTIDYDYVSEYKNQFHTSGNGDKSIPLFSELTIRNPATNQTFYPKNEKLFTNFSENVNEKMNLIHGNRRSSLIELSNLKMNMNIKGRTDIEVGRMFFLNYPAMGGLENKSDSNLDKHYSGWYLITAMRHKINLLNHTISIEAIKDDLRMDKTNV
jgi:hypothetical protein